MSTCAEVAIAQAAEELKPGGEHPPEGWVDARFLESLIALRQNLDVLSVGQVAAVLRKGAPDWFHLHYQRRVNAQGCGIGPEIWYRQDSAEWLVSVCGKIRDLLDQEIAEVTGRPVSDQ